MDEDSQFGGIIKGGLAATGLGAVVAVWRLPAPYGIYVALLILLLFICLFGGYFLWRRIRTRRQREQFTSAIETQTAAVPKAISDPNKRADLDRVRQKFQNGIQEFKSRSKDIYKLPWYVIVGESGSGKTEAIRHSGIDFPPGLQDELQGSGGTVNMDWWFTNRGIILDTAGSMLFNESRAGEAPEWREFLRLLKKARPHCPINGLFLVLSVESLIRDSADTIAQKASRLAQQLDVIQRTLDVRFPVYLLVTKCDLLTGFREFFENIDDPLLQHQMFGWSNPEPLDAHFRPDLVEEHLGSVAARLRRRRMALLRDPSGAGRLGDTAQFFSSTYQLGRGPAPSSRRLDAVDALFSLPESVMRLAPRLRRYLENVFVAGEWSAKPVFLRGIYFTSSMSEGSALDEAISLATGISLDQLPEERTWEKNKSYFLRDLFNEKVFRESGLVTRATNTLQMLRKRQFAIFGTAGAALLIFLVFSGFAYHNLKQSALDEASFWHAGAVNWKQDGDWSPSIVSPAPIDGLKFVYGGTNLVTDKLTLVQYHEKLRTAVEKPLAVSWMFKPMAWFNAGSVKDRVEAQRLLFEASVLKPLVKQSREKMVQAGLAPTGLPRHKDALLSLIQLEADRLKADGLLNGIAATKYFKNFLSYLTEEELKPDTNLTGVLLRTYSTESGKKKDGLWPPKILANGRAVSNHLAVIKIGLEKYQNTSVMAQTNIEQHLALVDDFAKKLEVYHQRELNWFGAPDPCPFLSLTLKPAKDEVDSSWHILEVSTNFPTGPLTNLAFRYNTLAAAASNASVAALYAPVNLILFPLSATPEGLDFSSEISSKLSELAGGAAKKVLAGDSQRAKSVAALDSSYLAFPSNSPMSSFLWRWSLYTNSCALETATVTPDERTIGDEWRTFQSLQKTADDFRRMLVLYNGPFAEPVSNLCGRIAAKAEQALKARYVDDYVELTSNKLSNLAYPRSWAPETLNEASGWLARIDRDLAQDACSRIGTQKTKLGGLRSVLTPTKQNILLKFRSELIKGLGFPILLDSTRIMSLAELMDLRKRLDRASNALTNEIWQSEDNSALVKVRNTCASASDIVNSLVSGDGTAADWHLFFVPPKETDPEGDRAIISIFKAAVVSAGTTGSTLPDLTKADANDTNSCALGKIAANAGLSILFRQFATGPGAESKGISYPDWALVRLIQQNKARPSANPGSWIFKIPLAHGNIAGEVTFEARLGQPLPKKEAWPKPD